MLFLLLCLTTLSCKTMWSAIVFGGKIQNLGNCALKIEKHCVSTYSVLKNPKIHAYKCIMFLYVNIC